MLDGVGTGTCGDLFHPEQMIKGKEDASNDDVRGHYMVGLGLFSLMLDGIGNLADQYTESRASLSSPHSAGAGLRSPLLPFEGLSGNSARSRISSSRLPGAAGVDADCRSVQLNPGEAGHDGPLGLDFGGRSRNIV
jgi:hypothetical protein